MREMHGTPREIRFLAPAFVVLFAGLILLAVFLITGQSSRAQILVEYEAERIASGLLETFRTLGALDAGSIDSRVRAFGIYRADGSLVTSVGSVPQSLGSRPDAPALSYDGQRRTLVLVRPLGVGGPGRGAPGMGGRGTGAPGMRGMMRRMMDGSGARTEGPGHEGPGSGAALYLSLDISQFLRTQALSRAAAFVSPLLIAGIAAAFLLLLTSNLHMRRRTEEQETLARLGFMSDAPGFAALWRSRV